MTVKHFSFSKLAKTKALQKADQFCEMTREHYPYSNFFKLSTFLCDNFVRKVLSFTDPHVHQRDNNGTHCEPFRTSGLAMLHFRVQPPTFDNFIDI